MNCLYIANICQQTLKKELTEQLEKYFGPIQNISLYPPKSGYTTLSCKAKFYNELTQKQVLTCRIIMDGNWLVVKFFKSKASALPNNLHLKSQGQNSLLSNISINSHNKKRDYYSQAELEKYRICVLGVPPSMTDHEFNQIFCHIFGEIKHSYIKRDPAKKKFLGFVTFYNEKITEKAIEQRVIPLPGSETLSIKRFNGYTKELEKQKILQKISTLNLQNFPSKNTLSTFSDGLFEKSLHYVPTQNFIGRRNNFPPKDSLIYESSSEFSYEYSEPQSTQMKINYIHQEQHREIFPENYLKNISKYHEKQRKATHLSSSDRQKETQEQHYFHNHEPQLHNFHNKKNYQQPSPQQNQTEDEIYDFSFNKKTLFYATLKKRCFNVKRNHFPRNLSFKKLGRRQQEDNLNNNEAAPRVTSRDEYNLNEERLRRETTLC